MLFHRTRILHSNRGFTLVELMLAMVISAIVLMTAYNIFKVQQRNYANQLDITIMQQNLRGAMEHLSRDIRMAGYGDPGMAAAKLIEAKPNLIYFTVDLNEDGDVNDTDEHIAYDIYTNADGDPLLRKIKHNSTLTVTNIGPNNWTVTGPTAAIGTDDATKSLRAAADNIEHLYFRYLDQNGNQTFAEDMVRSVEITLVARADKPDPEFNNVMTYRSLDTGTTWAKNDNYRRRIHYMSLILRNAGI